MLVRTYVGILIVACCLCSLALVVWIEHFGMDTDALAKNVASDDLAMRDLEYLEQSFEQWLVLSDLVLASGETYLANGSLRMAQLLEKPLARFAAGPFPTETAELRKFVQRQSNRLRAAAVLKGEHRDARLGELTAEMDEEAEAAVMALADLRGRIVSVSQERRDALLARRSRRVRNDVLAIGVYLAATGLLWRWISRSLTVPLQRLSQDAASTRSGTACDFSVSGPAEVQQLGGVLTTLVDGLNEQIAAHRRTQEDRESISQRLVKASRQAGMAEVAAGILHNVGNVLNSVNVSVRMLQQTIRTSRLGRLEIAMGVFQEHRDDPGKFLVETSQGRAFPQVVIDLSRRIGEEHASALDELDALERNVDHIKDVISKQQRHARLTLAIESVELGSVIDEAVSLCKPRLIELGVEVAVDVAPNLIVGTDSHTLIEILVNLIRNAAEASVVQMPDERTVRIRVEPLDESMAIRIEDNGVGIESNQLTQIFQYGFTTKSDGNGFGLHSSALAAQTLGGELTADSQGKGCGATFTLSIPREVQVPCEV